LNIKGEQLIADQLLDDRFWSVMWYRVEKSLDTNNTGSSSNNNDPSQSAARSRNADTAAVVVTANKNMEKSTSSYVAGGDWSLISPYGYLDLARLTLRVMTMSAQNCVYLIAKDKSHMFDVLSSMLSDEFLSSMRQL
jgi:hypothetical protein